MTEKTKKEKKVIVIPARENRNSENGQEKKKRRVAAAKGIIPDSFGIPVKLAKSVRPGSVQVIKIYNPKSK